MNRSLAAVLSLAGFAAAQARVLPYPVTEPAAYRAALAAGTRAESGAPGPRYWTDGVEYRIDAELDPATARLRGHVEATWRNRSPVPESMVWMHLRQNLHVAGQMRTRVVELGDGVEIDGITIDGAPVRARPRGTRLALRLPEPLAPGGTATIAMDFAFTVPRAGGAPRNGHEDHHVFYIAYWYPQFAVRDDVEGWVCEEYRGNGEFYMPYGRYDLTFRAPAGFLVAATGVLQNADELLHDSALRALAAARETRDVQHVITADDLRDGRVTKATDGVVAWHFVAEDVRDVAVSVSDRYVWDATHAVAPGRDPVGIHAVYEPTSRSWPAAAEVARHTIEWMSREVYPYPWPHMTACEGIIGGGMEFPMMTLIGDSRNVRGLQSIVTHELIHMWVPMIAGSNEKRHSWMDEGTTSFFTDLALADLRETPRVARQSMLGYVRTARGGAESPMMTHADYYPVGYQFASYTKPAALLHQLRAMLMDGDRDVLMEALRAYLGEWAMKHPSPYDLFRTVERFAGRDLDWYWQPWYFEVRTLDHAIGAVVEAGGELVVTVEDRGFVPQPCVVRAYYGEGREVTATVAVDHWLAGNTTAELRFPGGATEIRIDPASDTLDVDPANNGWKPDR